MKKIQKAIAYFIFALLPFTLFNCSLNDDDDSSSNFTEEEKVVVANRGSSSISIIDPATSTVTNTVNIPNSEPMYVVFSSARDRIYVGDRLGKKVHIINPTTYAIENSIDVGNGVFHMWADGLGKELWVNNDIDNTISVINLASKTVTHTINVDMKPHDVFVTADGTKAYVSVINSDTSMPDKVYMYNTSTYTKTGEANVGKDPHLYHLSSTNRLFVPCQSGQLYELRGNDLTQVSSTNFQGAHGIYSSSDQSMLFVSNISNQQLYSINASTNTQIGTAITTLNPTPHNVAINGTNTTVFVTHSGASSNTVSTYNNNAGTLTAGTTISVGTNPFGITYYRRLIQ